MGKFVIILEDISQIIICGSYNEKCCEDPYINEYYLYILNIDSILIGSIYTALLIAGDGESSSRAEINYQGGGVVV